MCCLQTPRRRSERALLVHRGRGSPPALFPTSSFSPAESPRPELQAARFLDATQPASQPAGSRSQPPARALARSLARAQASSSAHAQVRGGGAVLPLIFRSERHPKNPQQSTRTRVGNACAAHRRLCRPHRTLALPEESRFLLLAFRGTSARSSTPGDFGEAVSHPASECRKADAKSTILRKKNYSLEKRRFFNVDLPSLANNLLR